MFQGLYALAYETPSQRVPESVEPSEDRGRRSRQEDREVRGNISTLSIVLTKHSGRTLVR